jgi:hypothetical protein
MAAQRRSPEEVAKSMEAAKKIKAQQVLKEQKSRIKWAKYALLFIGILQSVVTVVGYFVLRWSVMDCAIDGIIGIMFIGLYFLSQEKPKAAFTIGLLIFGIIQLTLILIDERNLVRGILMKIIIFSTLFGGLNALKRIPVSLLGKKGNDDLLDAPESDQDLI